MDEFAELAGMKATEAAKALAAYLDQAGIVRIEDRISALRRQYAVTWLDMLRRTETAGDLNIFDIIAGRESLIDQMRTAEEQ